MRIPISLYMLLMPAYRAVKANTNKHHAPITRQEGWASSMDNDENKKPSTTLKWETS